MAYDRYRQGQRNPQDYSPDRNDTYSSARDYDAAGYYDRDRGGYGQQQQRGGYGGYAQGGGYDDRPGGYYGSSGRGGYDRGASQQGDRWGVRSGQNQGEYRGSYAHDGHRFNEGGDRARGGYGRQPQGYDYQDRGFFDRAGDEVRSWFGDDEAERRREADARLDERYSRERDDDYGNWRRGQIAALDRDYDEYRNENRSKFENEFSSWRTERQSQRNSLGTVTEHMDVVGSDGSHVGTVDKVRGDRIVLTKNDQDAGGRHHSIPSRWIQSVDDKVTLRKTADEAKREWRDEERNQAFFNEDRDDGDRDRSRGGGMLNRSFSGTY